MKKFLIVSLVFTLVFLLTSCSKEQVGEKEGDSMGIEFQTGIYSDKNWTDNVGTYQNDIIPDKETAVSVAINIFNGMEKSAEAERFTVQSVFFDEVDEIWVVSFWEDRGPDFDGSNCSIAIQKKDGKVLRIWFGE